MPDADTMIAPPLPVDDTDRRRTGVPGLHWLPGVVVLAAAVAMLTFYGVSLGDTARFAAYLLLVIVVPGTLLWRATRLASGALVEELAVGSAIGYALQVGAYIGARAIGVPYLALLVPAAILIAFAATPALRHYWRGDRVRVPGWWAWSMTALMLLVFAWSAYSFLRINGITFPTDSTPYIDMPFHLSLAGELKNHVPPHIPYVIGQPLDYHWFVYTNLAGTSWATGIELQTLLYRLAILPMIMVMLVGFGAVARRMSGKWWTGVAAATFAVVFGVPDPFAWAAVTPTNAVSLFTWWISPTQTFGAAIFAGLMVLIVNLVRSPAVRLRERPLAWALAAVLILVMPGAKATFLPLLLCGLALAVAWDLVFNRRLSRSGLLLLAMTAVGFELGQFLLYRGTTGGMTWDPFGTIANMPLYLDSGVTHRGGGTLGLLPAVIIVVFVWLLGVSGALGLGLFRAWREPAAAVCLGIGAAGIGVAMLFVQSGQSQVYFWISAAPYLMVLAIVGIATALPAKRLHGRVAFTLAGAVVVGVLTIWTLRTIGGTVPPAHPAGRAAALARIVGPIAVFVLVMALLGVGVYLAQRRRSGRRGIGLALATALVATLGAGVLPHVSQLAQQIRANVDLHGLGYYPQMHRVVPAGGVEAARWLRDHSDPDDLVATNVHCNQSNVPNCDARNFWVSAYTERHVLVEGWAYTVEAGVMRPKHPQQAPFWDPGLLAANDAAFATPSAATVGVLRDRYGVRWMFVDERYAPRGIGLDAVATLRFRSGDCAVYEVPPA